jgi:dihydroneopterin aldolase
VLRGYPPARAVSVRVRKPGVPIDGRLEWAGVTVERSR